MTKTRIKKNVLGGSNYFVESLPGGHRVHKIVPKWNEDYFVDADGSCDCKASEFGNTCKHQGLAAGSLRSLLPFARDAADELVEDYLDLFRGDFPNGRLVSAVRYKPAGDVWNGTALGYNVTTKNVEAKSTLWTEYKGLLLRIHCFRDKDRYEQALTAIRQQWKK